MIEWIVIVILLIIVIPFRTFEATVGSQNEVWVEQWKGEYKFVFLTQKSLDMVLVYCLDIEALVHSYQFYMIYPLEYCFET